MPTLNLKEPVRLDTSSPNYGFILIDADDVRYYFFEDGTFDGWDAPGELFEKAAREVPGPDLEAP